MKPLVFGLVVGLAAVYSRGFGDASAGGPNGSRRFLKQFGVEIVERGDRRTEAPVDSTGAR